MGLSCIIALSYHSQNLTLSGTVRSEDSGTYICTATTGRFVNTDKAVLKVGGPGIKPVSTFEILL